MIKFLRKVLILIISGFLFGGCAVPYYNIKPETINYTTEIKENNINFSYRYDVLRERGNKRYAKKEDIKNIKVLAVRITNNSDNDIAIGKDLFFYCDSTQIYPLDPYLARNELKQLAATHLFYLLLTPMQLYTGNDSFPIGLILGPGISLGNLFSASSANNHMLFEFTKYYILNKTIKKGETAYGIFAFRNIGYNPLCLKQNF